MVTTVPGKLRPNTRTRTSRRVKDTKNMHAPMGPIHIIGASVSGSTMSVTFDEAVTLAGVPQIIPNVASRTPVSAAQPAANQIVITYNGSVATGSTLTVAYQDPGVRNVAGAFIAETYFNF